MEGFLPEFNYESMRKTIDEKREQNALANRQAAEKILTNIYDKVKKDK